MSVHLYKHNISYFSVPKCACTSLKRFFFEIENGFPFRPYRANGKHKHIHNAAYGSMAFESVVQETRAGHWKAAVVRDPLDRFVSCYRNRVLHHNELDRIELTAEDRARGLVRRPDLPTFVRFLDRYRELHRSIRHHSEPLAFYLGADPGYFDRIYPMRGLDEFVEEVRRRVGTAPKLAWFQTGGPDLGADALSRDERKRIEDFYARDYEAFGAYL